MEENNSWDVGNVTWPEWMCCVSCIDRFGNGVAEGQRSNWSTAGAGQMEERVLGLKKTLEEGVNWEEAKEYYSGRKLYMLPCMHMVCSIQCLEDLEVEGHSRSNSGANQTSTPTSSGVTSACPLCLRYFDESSVLKNSPVHPLQILNKEKVSVVTLCRDCQGCSLPGNQPAAIKRCMECEILLCPNCCKYHELMRMTWNHQLTEEGATLSIPTNKLCSTHKDQQVSTYCATCRLKLCDRCISTEGGHLTHELHELGPYVQQIKADLLALCEKAGKIADLSQTRARKLANEVQNLTNTDESVLVKEAKRQLYRLLTALCIREKEMTEDIVVTVSMKVFALNSFHSALSQIAQRASRIREVAASGLEENLNIPTIELFLNFRQNLDNESELMAKLLRYLTDDKEQPPRIKISPAACKELQKMITKIGKVTIPGFVCGSDEQINSKRSTVQNIPTIRDDCSDKCSNPSTTIGSFSSTKSSTPTQAVPVAPPEIQVNKTNTSNSSFVANSTSCSTATSIKKDKPIPTSAEIAPNNPRKSARSGEGEDYFERLPFFAIEESDSSSSVNDNELDHLKTTANRMDEDENSDSLDEDESDEGDKEPVLRIIKTEVDVDDYHEHDDGHDPYFVDEDSSMGESTPSHSDHLDNDEEEDVEVFRRMKAEPSQATEMDSDQESMEPMDTFPLFQGDSLPHVVPLASDIDPLMRGVELDVEVTHPNVEATPLHTSAPADISLPQTDGEIEKNPNDKPDNGQSQNVALDSAPIANETCETDLDHKICEPKIAETSKSNADNSTLSTPETVIVASNSAKELEADVSGEIRENVDLRADNSIDIDDDGYQTMTQQQEDDCATLTNPNESEATSKQTEISLNVDQSVLNIDEDAQLPAALVNNTSELKTTNDTAATSLPISQESTVELSPTNFVEVDDNEDDPKQSNATKLVDVDVDNNEDDRCNGNSKEPVDVECGGDRDDHVTKVIPIPEPVQSEAEAGNGKATELQENASEKPPTLPATDTELELQDKFVQKSQSDTPKTVEDLPVTNTIIGNRDTDKQTQSTESECQLSSSTLNVEVEESRTTHIRTRLTSRRKRNSNHLDTGTQTDTPAGRKVLRDLKLGLSTNTALSKPQHRVDSIPPITESQIDKVPHPTKCPETGNEETEKNASLLTSRTSSPVNESSKAVTRPSVEEINNLDNGRDESDNLSCEDSEEGGDTGTTRIGVVLSMSDHHDMLSLSNNKLSKGKITDDKQGQESKSNNTPKKHSDNGAKFPFMNGISDAAKIFNDCQAEVERPKNWVFGENPGWGRAIPIKKKIFRAEGIQLKQNHLNSISGSSTTNINEKEPVIQEEIAEKSSPKRAIIDLLKVRNPSIPCPPQFVGVETESSSQLQSNTTTLNLTSVINKDLLKETQASVTNETDRKFKKSTTSTVTEPTSVPALNLTSKTSQIETKSPAPIPTSSPQAAFSSMIFPQYQPKKPDPTSTPPGNNVGVNTTKSGSPPGSSVFSIGPVPGVINASKKGIRNSGKPPPVLIPLSSASPIPANLFCSPQATFPNILKKRLTPTTTPVSGVSAPPTLRPPAPEIPLAAQMPILATRLSGPPKLTSIQSVEIQISPTAPSLSPVLAQPVNAGVTNLPALSKALASTPQLGIGAKAKSAPKKKSEPSQKSKPGPKPKPKPTTTTTKVKPLTPKLGTTPKGNTAPADGSLTTDAQDMEIPTAKSTVKPPLLTQHTGISSKIKRLSVPTPYAPECDKELEEDGNTPKPNSEKRRLRKRRRASNESDVSYVPKGMRHYKAPLSTRSTSTNKGLTESTETSVEETPTGRGKRDRTKKVFYQGYVDSSQIDEILSEEEHGGLIYEPKSPLKSKPTPIENSTPEPTNQSASDSDPTTTSQSAPEEVEPISQSTSDSEPTNLSTPKPTILSTPVPTQTCQSTPNPTIQATSEPTSMPITSTPKPTIQPTSEPTSTPKPTIQPTSEPTSTPKPTIQATSEPTSTPKPTIQATSEPTIQSTSEPVNQLTPVPLNLPATEPTNQPTSGSVSTPQTNLITERNVAPIAPTTIVRRKRGRQVMYSIQESSTALSNSFNDSTLCDDLSTTVTPPAKKKRGLSLLKHIEHNASNSAPVIPTMVDKQPIINGKCRRPSIDTTHVDMPVASTSGLPNRSARRSGRHVHTATGATGTSTNTPSTSTSETIQHEISDGTNVVDSNSIVPTTAKSVICPQSDASENTKAHKMSKTIDGPSGHHRKDHQPLEGTDEFCFGKATAENLSTTSTSRSMVDGVRVSEPIVNGVGEKEPIVNGIGGSLVNGDGVGKHQKMKVNCCAVCQDMEVIGTRTKIFCDNCSKAFHLTCHMPPVVKNTSRGDFHCNFCSEHVLAWSGESLTDPKFVCNENPHGLEKDRKEFLRACKLLSEIFKLEEGVQLRRYSRNILLRREQDPQLLLHKVRRRLCFGGGRYNDNNIAFDNPYDFLGEIRTVLEEYARIPTLDPEMDGLREEFESKVAQLIVDHYTD